MFRMEMKVRWYGILCGVFGYNILGRVRQCTILCQASNNNSGLSWKTLDQFNNLPLKKSWWNNTIYRLKYVASTGFNLGTLVKLMKRLTSYGLSTAIYLLSVSGRGNIIGPMCLCVCLSVCVSRPQGCFRLSVWRHMTTQFDLYWSGQHQAEGPIKAQASSWYT